MLKKIHDNKKVIGEIYPPYPPPFNLHFLLITYMHQKKFDKIMYIKLSTLYSLRWRESNINFNLLSNAERIVYTELPVAVRSSPPR